MKKSGTRQRRKKVKIPRAHKKVRNRSEDPKFETRTKHIIGKVDKLQQKPYDTSSL
jgi:hypothetical protein